MSDCWFTLIISFRTGGRALGFQVLHLLLIIDFKLSFLIKRIVMAGSGDPESSRSYDAIAVGCWELPMKY